MTDVDQSRPATTEDDRAARIASLVDQAPPLSTQTRRRLAGLLRPPPSDGDHGPP